MDVSCICITTSKKVVGLHTYSLQLEGGIQMLHDSQYSRWWPRCFLLGVTDADGEVGEFLNYTSSQYQGHLYQETLTVKASVLIPVVVTDRGAGSILEGSVLSDVLLRYAVSTGCHVAEAIPIRSCGG